MTRTDAALFVAVGCAILVPPMLLTDRTDRPPPIQAAAPLPIIPSRSGSIDGARDLFAGAGSDNREASAWRDDLPEVIGVAGRLPDQAVALVRLGGGTRAIGMGESVDGWRLESIAADAVLFSRGDQRERVEVTSGTP